jgi:hypothetical protein
MAMFSEFLPESARTGDPEPAPAPWCTASDVARVVGRHGWLRLESKEETPELRAWFERAAMLLGPHVADETELADLLTLVFHYDAREVLDSADAPTVLARAGARAVIRELGREVLSGGAVDSDRMKEIFTRVRERSGYGGRELCHPLRLALAGRAGDGEMDRVILLVDAAARLAFAARVKPTRERILEFCSQMD